MTTHSTPQNNDGAGPDDVPGTSSHDSLRERSIFDRALNNPILRTLGILAVTMGIHGEIDNTLNTDAAPRISARTMLRGDRSTDASRGDLETGRHPSQAEIVKYFHYNAAQLKGKVARYATDADVKEDVIAAIDALANLDTTHDFRIQFGDSEALARYAGGDDRIVYLPMNFDLHSIGQAGNLVHETVHRAQDRETRSTVPANVYRNYWYHNGRTGIHPGEKIYVAENEEAATKAGTEYVNAMMDGRLHSVIQGQKTWEDGYSKLEADRGLAHQIPDANTRETLIGNALYQWKDARHFDEFIRYQYQCKDHASRFTPSLIETGHAGKAECDTLATAIGL